MASDFQVHFDVSYLHSTSTFNQGWGVQCHRKEAQRGWPNIQPSRQLFTQLLICSPWKNSTGRLSWTEFTGVAWAKNRRAIRRHSGATWPPDERSPEMESASRKRTLLFFIQPERLSQICLSSIKLFTYGVINTHCHYRWGSVSLFGIKLECLMCIWPLTIAPISSLTLKTFSMTLMGALMHMDAFSRSVSKHNFRKNNYISASIFIGCAIFSLFCLHVWFLTG